MKKGLFISFEGPEGSGKSTHISLLADFLRSSHQEVIISYEPGGGTDLAASLRKILLNNKGEISSKAELFLMLAARAEHVQYLIQPSLEKGAIVLCDRYIDSSLAYQGFGRGLDLDFIRQANNFATAGLSPDLTFLMDVDIQEGLKRAAHKAELDRIEKEKQEFHKRVRQGFLSLIDTDHRYFLLDCSQSVAQVQTILQQKVTAVLSGLLT